MRAGEGVWELSFDFGIAEARDEPFGATGGLRKAFVSLKGVYFQASVGRDAALVTWLVPHHFAQVVPPEVDLRIVGTFVEFYESLLKFVHLRRARARTQAQPRRPPPSLTRPLFRLYGDAGLAHPPPDGEAQPLLPDP